jgi:hypothetical protein
MHRHKILRASGEDERIKDYRSYKRKESRDNERYAWKRYKKVAMADRFGINNCEFDRMRLIA